MATLLPSFWILPGNQDKDGFRNFKLRRRVMDALGPADALATPGLPQMGDPWDINGDRDDWTFCGFEVEIKPVVENEVAFWDLTFTYSKWTCKDGKTNPSEDPILDPQKISGSFKTCQEEATIDRFGSDILNSSHELLRGKHVEFDKNKPTVKIEQNVLSLQLDLCSSMLNKVNSGWLWGLRPRTLKLGNFSFSREYYAQCHEYYKRSFEFEVDYNTWDRDVLDEGYKVLRGHWNNASTAWILNQINGVDPDPSKPADFMRYLDRNGNACKVVLDGAGRPFIPDILPIPTQWWQLVNANESLCLQITCAQARRSAKTNGYILGLPFSTEGGCTAALSTIDPRNPAAWASSYANTPCSGIPGASGNEPGSIHIEKYDEADFLQLGIPISL